MRRCSFRRSGKHVNVDVETDGFFEQLKGEHMSLTALTSSESDVCFTALLEKLIPRDFSAHGLPRGPVRAGRTLVVRYDDDG